MTEQLRPVVYLAHPLNAPTLEERQVNRRNAARWAAWIAQTFPVAVSADWIWMTEVLDETPENRALGLECDDALVRRCDLVIMVGPKITEGMARAADCGLHALDWTGVTLEEVAAFTGAFRVELRAVMGRRLWRPG